MADEQQSSRLRRNLYIFGSVSFFNDTASEMAYWILPAFISSLGAGPATLGLIEGIAESVAAAGKLFSGYLTDAAPRRKPIVVFGYLLANAVKPLLALASRSWHVLLIRFADRTAKGIRGTPRDVMLAESVDPRKIGSAYGFLQSLDSAGAIFGPLVAWWMLAHGRAMRSVFWLAVLPGFLAIVLVTLAREPQHRTPAGKQISLWRGPKLPFNFYYMLAAVLIFSIGNSSDMFLVLRAQQLGVPPALAPLLGLVFNITYTLFSWPAGWLSDRQPKVLMAAIGYLVFAVAYFGFAKGPATAWVWLIMSFYGLYYALTGPILRALVVETAAPGSRGRAFGLYYFSTSIATLLASLLTGELWKHYGARLPFATSAAMALLAALMLLGKSVYRRGQARMLDPAEG
ncbi:MAG TPA: MFS transporter [Candidatus Limnocylindrales bacterium]|jgi:MFS family permease|nr:MFS transporter [Candidatus Limnocylindrales bacterium]